MSQTALSIITKTLKKGRRVSINLRGKSMWPLIPDSSRIKLSPIHPNRVKPSDIVAFESNGKLIVHQCVFSNNERLVTWGVNNRMTDRSISRNKVIGIASSPFNTLIFSKLLIFEARIINKTLTGAGVNPIWMKGPIYSDYIYGHILDTKIPDLDVLISRNEFTIACKVLSRLGYDMENKKKFPRIDLPYKEISFFKKIGDLRINVDLHLIAIRCTFQKIFPQPLEPNRIIALNDELIKRTIKYKGFVLLNDTSSLIQLCLNLTFHHASRGIWNHARIAKLIEKGDIDWKKFELILKRFQMSKYVYFPLLWSKRMFGVQIKDLDTFKPSPVRLFLCKLAINRFVIGRQIFLDGRSINGWINNGIIFYIKIILHSFLQVPSAYKEQ